MNRIMERIGMWFLTTGLLLITRSSGTRVDSIEIERYVDGKRVKS